MNKLFYLLLLPFLSACEDKWDKRYEEQLRHQCKCVKEWQNSLPDNVEKLYGQASILSTDGDREPIDEEVQTQLLYIKEKLSDIEQQWMQRFGKEIKNKNSELYKCFYKKFEWSDEYPGNNYKYRGPDADNLGCSLVNTIIYLDASDEKLKEILFE